MRFFSTICAAGLTAALALGSGSAAKAQADFPSHPIRLVVPFSTGTGSDTLARIVSVGMGSALGQPVVVENRGGAGGISGTDHVARSAPDGYTLVMGTTSTLITNPALNPVVKYDVDKDLLPVAGLGRTYFVIVTANKPDAPKTLAELIARLQAGHGTFASSGVGTITQLASEALLLRARVKATHVPYKGSSQALSDVASGQTLFASDTLAAALPLIRSGLLRPLAVTSAERIEALRDVPAVSETPGLQGFVVDSWWGLMAPAGTPPPVVKKLGDAALSALAEPATRSRFAALELEPLALPAAQFGDYVRKQTPFWVDFIKKAGIKLE